MKAHLRFFLSLLLGNALVAFAVCAFVVPYGIMLGGSSGIALAIQNVLPTVPLSVISAVVYSLLFVIGWLFLGRKFALTTLLSTILNPLFLAVFEFLPVATLFRENILVVGVVCGAMTGFGIGLVVRAGGSTGGMDIPPCILHKYFGIPVGTSLLFFDTAIVLLQVAFRGIDNVLMSILVIMITSVTINRTVLSGERKVQIIIISPKYETIRREILDKMDCGATMLDIETGYEGNTQKAVLSVVYARMYPQIRDAALKIDSQAFVVASEVTNVNGRGYTLERDYNNN